MATRIAYRFVSGDLSSAVPGDSAFELDESDIYSAAFSSSEPPISRRTERQVKKSSIRRRDPNGSVSSLPVNVPNWSTILRDEHGDRKRRRGDSLENDFDYGNEEGDEDFGGCRDRLPPHEFLARARTASFSVQVGVGRTLKGRDLSRVRNAVWARTGFLD
ncbi:hypothetical protein SAY86_020314 [Trapa natans]|uniref:Senescence regulator n=1 Tax=Trapa natans TaxID=22666 RepID=A0AAN7M1H3_TRANT|nr:hypothetical protein SAY86_020314 [Trapa natans]